MTHVETMVNILNMVKPTFSCIRDGNCKSKFAVGLFITILHYQNNFKLDINGTYLLRNAVFFKENVRYLVWTHRDPISLILET